MDEQHCLTALMLAFPPLYLHAKDLDGFASLRLNAGLLAHFHAKAREDAWREHCPQDYLEATVALLNGKRLSGVLYSDSLYPILLAHSMPPRNPHKEGLAKRGAPHSTASKENAIGMPDRGMLEAMGPTLPPSPASSIRPTVLFPHDLPPIGRNPCPEGALIASHFDACAVCCATDAHSSLLEHEAREDGVTSELIRCYEESLGGGEPAEEDF